jgi:hypothetical protein
VHIYAAVGVIADDVSCDPGPTSFELMEERNQDRTRVQVYCVNGTGDVPSKDMCAHVLQLTEDSIVDRWQVGSVRGR